MTATTEWATVLAEARRVAADIGRLLDIEVDAATMLTGRAAIMDRTAQGRISAGGATRLLATADGWCAVALPRDDDVEALPALMEVDEVAGDHWAALTRWAAACPTENVVARAQLLDIAAAALGEAAAASPAVLQRQRRRLAGLQRIAGSGSVVAVGRPVVRSTAGPRRRDRRQGGKPQAGLTAPGAVSRPSSTG